ncbi:MAG: right-handed parallel beta-helix repeat-containing protein, partial [Planctomycetota bacterium]
NYGSRSGGGIMVRGAPAIIQDNVIANNSVGTPDFFLGIGLVGGGIALWGGDASIVENNLIYGNSAVDPFCCYGEGGGIGMYLSDSPELSFNTIVGNTARIGGGISGTISAIMMSNCIVFGNTALMSDPSVYSSSPGVQPITYSCIAGGYPGLGNFDADPQFEAGLAGDYYLSATSPCVDAGDPLATPPVGTTQVSQELDFGIADLGYHAPIVLAPFRRGEVNIDGLVNIADGIFVLSWLFGVGSPAPVCFDAADANDDGLVDIADPIGLLTALFVSGSPPIPAPSAACGADTTPDALPCPDTGACAGFP